MDIKSKIEELRKKINSHNYRYYVENTPAISDYDFDALLRELQNMEESYPQFDDVNSPTKRVGSDKSNGFESVKHRYPMLSLSNTYSQDELSDFCRKIEEELEREVQYVCELKFDGTAICIIYENGKLLKAVTRGDGSSGDDVTENVRTINSVPLELIGSGYPNYFEVRGEILMPYSSFDRLNAERELNDEQPFANPRNAAAGTLKLQNSSIVAKRSLDCFIYNILGEELPHRNHYENTIQLKEWGFKVSEQMKLCSNATEVWSYVESIDKMRVELPYATDGVVVKVNKYDIQKQLGSTAKAPKWSVAYKFKAEQALTKLLSVDFQVGRTGAITPVANLEPVQLAGTTVKRASLHNSDQITLLDIRVGDMVYVEKGGEIIPKITEVELSMRSAGSHTFEYITNCPECNTPLVKFEGEAKSYCPNQGGCAPQILGRIEHFVARKGMNIDGLGGETIVLLHNNGLVNNIADLYSLHHDQLVSLPRLGAKSADNIVKGIENSLNIPFARVLFALGIRFVGETTAKYIASHFKNLEAIMAASTEQLIEADEVGSKIAESIQEYFRDENNLEIIRRLSAANLQMSAESIELVSENLTGKNFVISGSFIQHSRDELKALIEQHGGKILSAVSSNTNFLIAGNKIGPAKLTKATKLNINIISETEFINMIASTDNVKLNTITSENDNNVTQGSLF